MPRRDSPRRALPRLTLPAQPNLTLPYPAPTYRDRADRTWLLVWCFTWNSPRYVYRVIA
jgi:hypothetical protein